MADGETSAEDRTEAPSQKRLNKAYDEGSLPIGRDFNAVAGFAAGTAALFAFGGGFQSALVRLVAASAEGISGAANPRSLLPLIARPIVLVAAIAAAAGAAGAVTYVAQTRGRVWLQLAVPDLSKVFSGGKIKQLFSLRTVTDLSFSFVKLLTVGWAAWSTLRADFLTLPRLLFTNADTQFTSLFAPLARGSVKVLTVMAFWAGVDLALQRRRFTKQMKMTKEEAKREYREEDGDPMMKGRRRRKHRELSKGRAQKEVPRADALVVNPTHIAIAIRYRPGESAAPQVTAKGKGQLAEFMRDLARENGIPIVENIPLARLLYRRVKVGKSVPAETYKAVAAILAYVYRITGRGGAQRVAVR